MATISIFLEFQKKKRSFDWYNRFWLFCKNGSTVQKWWYDIVNQNMNF